MVIPQTTLATKMDEFHCLDKKWNFLQLKEGVNMYKNCPLFAYIGVCVNFNFSIF